MDLNTPLDLRKWLGRAPDRLHRIGIELEGGWRKLPEGVRLTHDGSVNVEDRDTSKIQNELSNLRRSFDAGNMSQVDYTRNQQVISRKYSPLSLGELPSEPLEREKVAPWMRKFYPSNVNGTCGLHVHMSFTSALHYQRLMIPSYQATILEYIRTWAKEEGLLDGHPIWGRLDGKSEYCQNKYFADAQVAQRQKGHNRGAPGHRYTVINYCYGTHGTMECRLLPMMEEAEQGIRAVQRVLDVTNAFLVAVVATHKEEKVRRSLVILSGDEGISESRRETV